MTTTQDSETTIQLVVLEEMFNEELRCEANYHETAPCSITVTHLAKSCEPSHRICLNAATEALEWIEAKDSSCQGCGRNIEDCWRIIPI